MYKKDRYKEVQENNKEMKVADITKIISEEWRDVVSNVIKQRYKDHYELEKEKYLNQMKEYVS